MAVTAIISLTTSKSTDTTIEELTQALNASNATPRFFIGTKVQDPTTIQITLEWTSSPSHSSLSSSPSFTSLTETIRTLTSSPLTITLASLNNSPFAHDIPSLVEFVKTDFSASSVTPAFKTQIEADFTKFENILRKRGTPEEAGEVGLAVGWTDVDAQGSREENRTDASAEKEIKSFVVVRGWQGMESFQKAVQSEEFREAIPLLQGWGVPFELWHVERKAVGGGL